MTDFIVHAIDAGVAARVTSAMPPLDAATDARVEQLWQAAIRRVHDGGAGRLFNGRVFSADAISPNRITGHLTEFRRIVAQMDDPSLGPVLRVRPLAVCGVLLCRDGIVIGRRPAAAVYQPGMWQLPPAGSVDHHAVAADGSVDLIGQVLAELAEELGLAADQVSDPRPLCAVEHPGSRVTDLGIALRTALAGEEVVAIHRVRANAEYGSLLPVPYDRIDAFVAQAGAALVPPAREFLYRLGLLRQGLAPSAGR